MIGYAKDREWVRGPGPKGGQGEVEKWTLLTPEDTGGKIGLCNYVNMLPGSSIGGHPHTEDGEMYLVVEGELVFIENGVEHVLHPGDVTYTWNGDSHAMVNRSGKNAKMLAIIVK